MKIFATFLIILKFRSGVYVVFFFRVPTFATNQFALDWVFPLIIAQLNKTVHMEKERLKIQATPLYAACCLFCVSYWVFCKSHTSMCSGEQQRNPETCRDSQMSKWPMKFFWRWGNWPMGEQVWLEVIYAPDIFNQITQHPLRCDYCDAQSSFLCAWESFFFYSSQSWSNCRTGDKVWTRGRFKTTTEKKNILLFRFCATHWYLWMSSQLDYKVHWNATSIVFFLTSMTWDQSCCEDIQIFPALVWIHESLLCLYPNSSEKQLNKSDFLITIWSLMLADLCPLQQENTIWPPKLMCISQAASLWTTSFIS